MRKWSWERLARQEARIFRSRTDGRADINFRIHDDNIDIIVKANVNSTYTFDNWSNVYEALRAMNEAYLLGFKWGLKQ